MGTTAATMHILRPAGAAPDFTALVTKAYAKLGWAPPRRKETATRHVVLAMSGQFLTVHDSTCAALDDGTLREAAALLSKSADTATIVTTIHDSDAFNFLLFHRGKQVDGASEPEFAPEDGIKTVRGKRQANLWASAFNFGHFAVVNAAGPRLTNQLNRFGERSNAAARLESAFADDRLAAWCVLAGLPPETAVATPDDAEAAGRVVARIALTERPLAAKRPAPEEPTGRQLVWQVSADDCPYHGFFPAPWPCIPTTSDSYWWGVTCRGGGIARLRVRFDVQRTGAFAVQKIDVKALSFHQGQVMSMTPLAQASLEIAAGEAVSATNIILDAPDFGLRDPVPGSRSQVLLLIDARVTAPIGGEITLTPELTADDQTVPLPSLRLRAEKPAWVPAAARSGEPNRARIQSVLRLNTPSLHTAVAIVPEPEDSGRGAVRALAEQFFAPAGAAGAELRVSTLGHMTPGFTIPKSSAALPVAEAFEAKKWVKWFDRRANHQTACFGLAVPGAAYPLAGMTVQTAIYRRRGPAAADPAGPLFVSLWANAAPDATAALGVDWRNVARTFATWIESARPEQGWVADCAWMPIFTTYEDFHATPYEATVATSSGRALAEGFAELRERAGTRLKFVAPRMWLGTAQADRVTRAALDPVAEVVDFGAGLAISLRAGATLSMLEAALSPILPGG
jgi:hypothetical protein